MSESIILNLNGIWKLRDFVPGQGLAAGAHLPDMMVQVGSRLPCLETCTRHWWRPGAWRRHSIT